MASSFVAFDLSKWKLTLPVDSSGGTSGRALDVVVLTGFQDDPYFYTAADGGLVFAAPVDGATTVNSSYPRCELRELINGKEASWQLTQGGTMTATLAIHAWPGLSDGTAAKMVIGQIHGADAELARLYFDNGNVYFRDDKTGAKNKEATYYLYDDQGRMPAISAGERFSYRITAQGSTLTVTVFTGSDTFSRTVSINSVWQSDHFYFKAGVYLGANADTATGGGEVEFYGLDSGHAEGAGLSGLVAIPVLREGAAADDALSGMGLGDVLNGHDGQDTLYGMSGNDTLDGGAGHDRLDGGTGADSMTGGLGDDSFVVDDEGDVVVEAVGGGTDTVLSGLGDYVLPDNVEVLILTGTGNSNGTGNRLDNVLIGNGGDNRLRGAGGNDRLDGGAGADTMSGATGDDRFVVDNAGDVVVEYADGGTDTVESGLGSYQLGEAVENLVLTGVGDGRGTGNALENRLTGNDGNNYLDGGAGADTLSGGLGDDTYVVDDAGDVVVEAAGGGTDTVISGLGSYVLAEQVENLVLSGDGDSAGTGNGLDNGLIGNGGGNYLDGGGGADRLSGGLGDDSYGVDDAGDVVIEAVDGGTDTVFSGLNGYGLADQVENLVLTGTDDIAGSGNGLDNRLSGNAGSNALYGGDGNDVIDGGGGADTLSGGAGDDSFVVDAGDVVIEAADAGTDTVFSAGDWGLGDHVEHLTLTGSGDSVGTGNGLDNALMGNDGANRLDGGAGADTLSGGLGDDSYVVDSGDVVVEAADGGTDTVLSAGDWVLAANVENLVLSGDGDSAGTGNDLDNLLSGNDGANWLDGAGGADTLSGGLGDDSYVVDGGDVVVEAADAGTDTVVSAGDWVLGDGVENLVLTGSSDRAGTGNELDNLLSGNDGGNWLDGAAGADTLSGGLGDDSYVVDAGDVVVEMADAGTDTVFSAGDRVLEDGVENLTLTGSGDSQGMGNGLDNLLIGNDGGNWLDGAGGADTLSGGLGDDSYGVDAAGDVVVEAADGGTDTVSTGLDGFGLSDGVEGLVLTGDGDIGGTGNALDNVISGTDGANRLDGGGGADTLSGGLGDDSYVVDDAGDVVVEAADGGSDTVLSGVDYGLGAAVENLVLTGAAVTGTGNGLDNRMTGNEVGNILDGGDGHDRMDGGAGADTLSGGLGNDTFVVDDAGDVVIEAADAGTDTVESGLYAYSLGAAVENLLLTGSSDSTGTGNELGNVLVGNGGDNWLDGAAGADTLIGGLGDDSYVVDSAGDAVVEAADGGTDTVITGLDGYVLGEGVENLVLTGVAVTGTGNDLDNVLTGQDGHHALFGGGGNDWMDGGSGADTLSGGLGDDSFVVDAVGDTVIEAAGEGTDTVYSRLASYVLSGNVERLVLTGSGDGNGIGNGLDNVLTGNDGRNVMVGGAGNDALDGGGGADRLIGGTGDDTYVLGVGDTIIEQDNEGIDTVVSGLAMTTLGYTLENIVLTGDGLNANGNNLENVMTGNGLGNVLQGGNGHDVLNGMDGNDVLAGGRGVDWLYGGNGDDVMDGGEDGDVMAGGLGSDTYSVENAGDVVVELGNAGTADTVKTNLASYVLGDNIENLILTGAGNVDGTGNSLNNIISGNGANNILIGGRGDDTLGGGAGDDLLNGGTGADRMIGGAGNDTYQYGVGDAIIEAEDGGIDTVLSSVAAMTLGYTLENVTLFGPNALSANGNGLDNVMIGNGLDNVLQGGNGSDTISGMAGADVLNGGKGADVLSGGAGSDVFVYRSVADSAMGAADVITDMSGADILDFRLIDADVATAGDQAFHLVDGFSGAAGEMLLVYDAGAAQTAVYLDVNGDGVADFALVLTGAFTDAAGWLM